MVFDIVLNYTLANQGFLPIVIDQN